MAASYPRRQPSSQSSSSHDSRSRRSNDSYTSHSTAPTSLYSSPCPSDLKDSPSSTDTGAYAGTKYRQNVYDSRDDVSPATSLYPRSSVETYASTTASSEDVEAMFADEVADYECGAIPPLPIYRREVVEPNVRASTPQDFAKLFPSLNRLTIRHDEFTSDGNMNLRIDTVVTGRRRTAIQLFHLRMYDLGKREFSLRRYSRDSGREVCNSKRKFTEPAAARPKTADGKPTLKRTMSTALKTLGGGKPVLRRAKSAMTSPSRPSTGYSTSEGDEDLFHDGSNQSRLSLDSRLGKGKAQRPVPTNTIKLEFSNYARVDVNRRGGKGNKRYEFEWWGHRYSWKRSVDKQLGLVSFHLVRDGNAGAPVAHIVPETRSPTQVVADDSAGGWVPPCFMWIADEAIVDAVTDVADVIMATGLMTLVDDCIKERWQTKKAHRIPMPSTFKSVNFDAVRPKAIMQHVFGRRNSNDHQRPSPPSSPLRHANPAAAQ
ncbi:hypothetical protein CHGG_03954 [Chaetomium globosum CBS 148.51]|uniref:Uncharacterized protein n=1 Tax=Chaetomium globosum (strain ATCC 6205 / CBS 148.51 / DSM 1962 / NBRC 6347 / NRRL 1970) TaxID=306901 RepID=Q2H2P2_CHAGB|nr:uncharacterized protein CHGG_03954 [Chaetomium globosum CBS 148.51]EAQ87335.1 hypothetical protein CHGG_03954 [Chaetomium globosum CBS 148.51]